MTFENGNDYMNKNLIFENGKIEVKEEGIKKSEFKDFLVLRRYLIQNPQRAIEYDDKQELRPSCVEKFDVLVQAFDMNKDNSEMSIENWNYLIEQKILVWRGGY